jgi:lysophospholipase L1-like esterase
VGGAAAGEDWLGTVGAASAEVFAGRRYDPYLGYVLPDHEGEGLNVLDRERAGHRFDATDAAAEVWVFGGSALFGFASQRDEHTVPSELARRAEASGVPLRVRNFGAPGYTSYQESLLLADLLLDGEVPDVVVFFDGYNDVGHGAGATYLGAEWADGPAHIASDLGAAAFEGEWDGPPELGLGRTDEVPPLAQVAAEVASTYDRARRLAVRLGAAFGFEVVHAWQPSAHTMEVGAHEEALLEWEGFDGPGAVTWSQLYDEVEAALDPDVVDLGGVLDDLDEPVMVNAVHFDERGAAVVADALWTEVQPLVPTGG